MSLVEQSTSEGFPLKTGEAPCGPYRADLVPLGLIKRFFRQSAFGGIAS